VGAGAFRDLFHRTIQAYARASPLRQSGKISRIDRLIEAGAWTEATLSVIELELLDWTVRRVAREQGERLCSLSRQPECAAAGPRRYAGFMTMGVAPSRIHANRAGT